VEYNKMMSANTTTHKIVTLTLQPKTIEDIKAALGKKKLADKASKIAKE